MDDLRNKLNKMSPIELVNYSWSMSQTFREKCEDLAHKCKEEFLIKNEVGNITKDKNEIKFKSYLTLIEPWQTGHSKECYNYMKQENRNDNNATQGLEKIPFRITTTNGDSIFLELSRLDAENIIESLEVALGRQDSDLAKTQKEVLERFIIGNLDEH